MNDIYSRKELENILNRGQVISVVEDDFFTPTEFCKAYDDIYFRNKALNGDAWIEHPKTFNEILNQLENMQKEGLAIQIVSIADEYSYENVYPKLTEKQENTIDNKAIVQLTAMLEKILDNEPPEERASDTENEMFAEMQNLLESTKTYLYYTLKRKMK